MTGIWAEAVGWTASAVIAMSFLFTDVVRLRLVQICGAVLWTIYGILISSLPIVFANVLVFVVASWTTARYIARRRPAATGTG
jgi:hypothetical protein